MDLHSPLKKFFGFNKFKGLQEQVIKSIVNKENTFVIMPTGGGKSLCYQIPALALPGCAVVISPLIALMNDQMTWSRFHLDIERMREGAKCLLGVHDFTSFRAAQCQAKHPVREILRLDLVEKADLIVMEIQATAFLHHMVRNITGSLLVIGQKERPVAWMLSILQGKDRTKAAATARPNGLYLVHVEYPEHFGLPKVPLGPLFLPD